MNSKFKILPFLALEIFHDVGLCQIGGWAIITPRPPHTTALTLVKFLPFSAMILCIHRRSPVNPNSLRFHRRRFAVGAAELVGVNPLGCPFRRVWLKSVHASFLSAVTNYQLWCQSQSGEVVFAKCIRILSFGDITVLPDYSRWLRGLSRSVLPAEIQPARYRWHRQRNG